MVKKNQIEQRNWIMPKLIIPNQQAGLGQSPIDLSLQRNNWFWFYKNISNNVVYKAVKSWMVVVTTQTNAAPSVNVYSDQTNNPSTFVGGESCTYGTGWSWYINVSIPIHKWFYYKFSASPGVTQAYFIPIS